LRLRALRPQLKRDPLGSATVDTLTSEEQLIVRVATATCFAYPFKSGDVPLSDVQLYVKELVDLYRRKPSALTTGGWDSQMPDLRSALEFCAQRLAGSAPDQAAELLAALSSSLP